MMSSDAPKLYRILLAIIIIELMVLEVTMRPKTNMRMPSTKKDVSGRDFQSREPGNSLIFYFINTITYKNTQNTNKIIYVSKSLHLSVCLLLI